MGDKGLTVGNKIALLGEHFNLTQEEWATELGVSRGTVAAYKHRKNANPDREKVIAISTRFGIPLGWFYEFVSDAESLTIPVPPVMDEAEKLANDGQIRVVSPEDLSRELQRFSENEEVLLPVWRGAVAGFDDECPLDETANEPPQSVPSFFLGGKSPKQFIVCLPMGVSMAPRIIQGDRVIVRLEPNPDPNTIVIARRPDGVNFIKCFRIRDNVPELHSINGQFPVISGLDGWVTRGVVVGIWKPYLKETLNIEFNGGVPLRG